MCSNSGPFCVPTFTCYNGEMICRRYCCNDADCGPTLTCKFDVQQFIDAGAPQIGVCGP
jgi:hypothetical protein